MQYLERIIKIGELDSEGLSIAWAEFFWSNTQKQNTLTLNHIYLPRCAIEDTLC